MILYNIFSFDTAVLRIEYLLEIYCMCMNDMLPQAFMSE